MSSFWSDVNFLWPAFATAVILVVSYLAFLQLFRTKNNIAPVTSCRVTRLFVHPVKSLEGFEVQSAEVLPRGLRYDREWVVVRARDTKVMTIREIPAMRRVKAEVEGGFLVLTNRPLQGAKESVRVAIGANETTAESMIEICGMTGTVKHEGAEVAAFLTKALNEGKAAPEEYFLGRIAQPRDPHTFPGVAKVVDANVRIRGQDESSLHILTEESLLWVQKQLNDSSLCAEVFRPNIVVEGVPFPEEDCWDTMVLRRNDGSSTSIDLCTMKHCDRCALPTTGLDGTRHKDFQPTKFLRSKHAIAPSAEGKPNQGLLGLNVNIRLPNERNVSSSDDQTVLGVVHIGDTLVVTSRRDPPKYL